MRGTTMGDNYHTTIQNYIKYDKNKHTSLTKNTYNIKSIQKTKAKFSHLLRHPAWKQSGTIMVEWEGMDRKARK